MKFQNYIFLSLLSVLFLSSCTSDKSQPEIKLELGECDSLDVKYTNKIAPLIANNCSTPGCHDNGSFNGVFTDYNGVKEKVDNGSFRNRVLVLKNMPPSNALTALELKEIECWLNAGAPNN
jgi:hypothetical protein